MFQVLATAEQFFTDKQLMRLFLVFMIFALSEAAFATAGVTYHGRLINPAGSPVVATVVRFRVQIRTPGPENCLLFEEEQVQDLSLTNGVFALDIGSTPTYRKDTTGLSFDRIFSNQGSFNVPGNCVFGNSYTPSYADTRKMEVFFNDGNFVGWEPLPTQTINYVPKAVDALQVGGFNATNLLRVENAGVPQSVSSMTSADFTEMMKLILGTSTQYTKAGQLNGSALPSLSTGQSLGWNGSAWTAVTPLTSSSLPNCNPGEVLKSNAGVLSCVNDATGGVPSDATTSSKGIVQISATGGIDVNAGVISLSDAGTAGTYYKVTTDAKGRVTSGAASLVEADIPNLTTAGKVSGSAINAGTIGGSASVNTSGNITTSGSVTGTTSVATQNLRIYESTNTYRVNFSAHPSMTGNYGFVLPAALPLTSGQVLSSDTSGNLSWSTPSAGSVTSVSGSAPISVTGTSTPTVSIAQANTTTSGYLSATDWNTFNNKLGTSSSFSGDVTGTSSATVIANNAVNSAKIADGSVGVADLDFAGAMATNTGVVVRNGTQFYNKTCAGNQALIWTVANGWSCSAVVLSESDPKVGTNTTNYLSKWDGSALVTSGVYEAGGNIGIGTSSPLHTLTVTQKTNSGIMIQGTTGVNFGNASLSLFDSAGNSQWSLGASSSGKFTFWDELNGKGPFTIESNAPDNAFMVKASGNVGIGTATPSEKFEVVGNIKATQLCIGADCRNAWPSGGGGSGTVTSVGSGTGLTGGPITGSGTLNVDVGTTTGKIVQVAAGNKLPAIDGSDLTNLNASNLSAGTLPTGRLPALTGDVTSTAGSNSVTLNTVPISKGGTGQTTATAALNALLPSQGSNSGKVLQTNGTSATWVTQTESDPKVGVNTTNYLSKWNGTALVTSGVYESSGNVGIGTATPGQMLTVAGTIESTSGGIKFPDGTIQITSAVSGTNNSMVSSFPDAIRCTLASPFFDRIFYIFYPNDGSSASYVDPQSTIRLVYNSDGSYNSISGSSTSNCNIALSAITSAGRGFNFAKGPAAQWLQSGSNAYYNAGNVGIGTANPTAKLHIAGTAGVDGIKFPDGTIQTTASSGGGGSAGTWSNLTASRTCGTSYTNNFSNPIQAIVSVTGGGGGVTATVAGTTFTIMSGYSSSTNMTGSVIIPSGATYSINCGGATLITWYELNNVGGPGSTQWTTSGADIFSNNSGNVGIGTTSPSVKFEVVGNVKATQLCIGADCRSSWPSGGGSGTVTSVASGTGLTGGPITGTGTLNVDVGTTAGKIVQVAAGNKLPAIDGSDLTNLNASNLASGTLPTGRLPALTGDVTSAAGSNSITLNTVPISKGGTGQTTANAALNALLPSQGTNSGKVLQTDGTNSSWVTPTGGTITALTGDVTASGTGSVAATIANNAVNSAKIADGTVGVADLNFAGTMATNTGIVVRDGTQLFNKTCTANQVLIWTVANGWSCSAAVLSESDPKVGSNTTNYLSKWNGSALVTSGVYEASGSVGIGTASPGHLLHVQKDQNTSTAMKVTNKNNGTSANSTVFLENDGASQAFFSLSSSTAATANALTIENQNSAPIRFGINGGERMVISANGNVGIGMTAGSRLDIKQASGTEDNIRFVDDNTANYWGISFNNSTLTYRYNTTDMFSMSPTGNFGIGTITPGYPLTVATGSGQFGNGIHVLPSTHATSRRASASIDDWAMVQDINGNGTKDFAIYQGSAAAHRLFINTSGSVGIGTSSPSQLLHLSGGTTYRGLTSSILSVNTVPGLVLETASSGEAAAITGATGVLKFYARSTAGSFAAGDQKMQIDPSGNVGIGTTTPGQKLSVAGTVESTSGGFKFPDGSVQTTASSGGNVQCAGAPGNGNNLIYCVNMTTGRAVYAMAGGSWAIWQTANQSAWTSFATGGPYAVSAQVISGVGYVIVTRLSDGTSVYGVGSSTTSWAPWNSGGIWPP